MSENETIVSGYSGYPAPECLDPAALVEKRIDNILTQYRESPKLLHLIRTLLRQVVDVHTHICDMPYYFDLTYAVGEQLTFLGKELGFPRSHCICNNQPVFGFECDDAPIDYLIGGFCDENVDWADCGPFGVSEISINNDEMYRAFLMVRRYQMLQLYDLDSLTTCLRILWGETAMVMEASAGIVVVAPGRELTQSEQALLQVYPRVLPVAPGVRLKFHFGTTRVFGFGEGWGGFCEPIGEDEASIITETEAEIVTENGLIISTGVLTEDAPWLCDVDTKPYNCADVPLRD